MTAETYQAEVLQSLDDIHAVLTLLDHSLLWVAAGLFGIVGLLIIHLFFLGKGDA